MRIHSDMTLFAGSTQQPRPGYDSAHCAARHSIRWMVQHMFTFVVLLLAFAGTILAQLRPLSPTNLALSLKPATAAVTVKPATLSFGNETVGKVTAAKTVTLTNNQAS